MLVEMLIKGWMVVVSVDDNLVLLEDKRTNVQLAVPRELAAKLPKGMEEGYKVRLEGWARCVRMEIPYRRYSCEAMEELRQLPCKPNEGMWVNGIQYC
jgi:hypothetical protein